MSNYPLTANKENWRTLHPQKNFMSEEYICGHYDLYLSTEYSKDEDGQNHRFYRLHAMNPHTIEMALAYDIKCPCCGSNTLKQVGRCLDSHELGLYECPVCDRK